MHYRKIVVTLSLALTVDAATAHAECWRSVVAGGTRAGEQGQAYLYAVDFTATDSDQNGAIISAKNSCRSWEDEKPADRACSSPDSYTIACDAPKEAASESKSPLRKFAETTIQAGGVIILIGGDFTPTAIVVAAAFTDQGLKIIDAYDKDRGDVKKFLENAGAEITPDKVGEWAANPAGSFARSDPGKVVEQAKDDFNRGDISKATGIKF